MLNAISSYNISGFSPCSAGNGEPAASAPDNSNVPGHLPSDRISISQQVFEKSASAATKALLPLNEEDMGTEEKQAVSELKKRDAEVKAHEQAHMAAGGGVVQGGAAYQYQSGPDGKMYAVGGEVGIDTSPAGSPEATIRKMQQIQRAALAPAQPSGTDRAVAAQAAQIEIQARLQKTQTKESEDDGRLTLHGAGPTLPNADGAHSDHTGRPAGIDILA